MTASTVETARRRGHRRGSSGLSGAVLCGLAALPLLSACASIPMGRPAARALPEDSGRVARPELGAEYDVLVGELAIREGRLEDARQAYQRAVAKDPDSAYLHYRLARLAAQTDDLAMAITEAETGLALDPDDLDGRLFLGRLYRLTRDSAGLERVLRDESGEPVDSAAALLLYQVYLEEGRLAEATEIAERLLAEEPENLGAYMAAATAYERSGRLDEAERTLRAALEHHPNRFVLYARLARMRRAAGDRDGEMAVYREVLAEYPGHYGTLVSLGEAQIAVNDIEGAIATYREIADLYPGDLQVVRRLASLEFGAGHYEEAAARLRRAHEQSPEHYEFAYSLGQVLRALGRDEEAAGYFASVPSSHPLFVESRMQIAVLHEEAGRLDDALVEVERLRELRPDRGLDFHAASLRARTGDFAGGLALLEGMLGRSPNDEEILYQIGVLYGIHKDVDQALHYMQRVLEQNPENAQALNYIGYTWAERGENLDEAERLIEQAVSLAPRDGYILDSLGWVYYMRARPLLEGTRRDEGLELLGRAIEQLNLADELTGGDPVVSEHLGDVYLLLDERQRALEYYEEAVDQNPREDEQPHLYEKLDRLRRALGRDPRALPEPGER